VRPIRSRPERVAPRTTLALLIALGAVSVDAEAANPTMAECIAANETSIKLRADHKLLQARDQALVCAAASCPSAIRKVCQQRITNLNGALPTLVFVAKDAGGNDLSAVAVTIDNQPLVDHLDGGAIAVDPGDHIFSFTAAGLPRVEKRIVLYEGEKGRREQITLGATPEISPAIPPFFPSPTSSGLGTRRVLGLALGGLGVVGIGVGSVFGALTFSAWSSTNAACGSGGTTRCSPAQSSAVNADRSSAETRGTISTVAFIAGGVLVAGGLTLFLTGGHHERNAASPAVTVAPTLGPGLAGVALQGAFH
jgi:hypothetical protein